MKRMVFAFLAVLLFFNIGCKFTETPAGVYTGTYTKPGPWNNPDTLPVGTGNGVLTIIDAGTNLVNIVFTSPGNPDVQFLNVQMQRQPYFIWGDIYDIRSDDYISYYYAGFGGMVYSSSKDVTFENFDTLGFIFEGHLQE